MIKTEIVVMLIVSLILTGCQETSNNNNSGQDDYSRILKDNTGDISDPPYRFRPKSNKIILKTMILSATESDYQALDVLWRYVDSDLISITRPSIYFDSGFKSGIADHSFQAQLELVKSRIKSAITKEFTATLNSGRFTHVGIGNGINIPLFYYKGHIFSKIEYEFDTCLKILRIMAKSKDTGHINVEITPVFKRLLNVVGDLNMQDLSFSVDLQPGKSIVIGGNDTGNPNASDAFLSTQISGKKSKFFIVITADYQ